MDTPIPQNFEETIINYLKSQESYPEHLDLLSPEQSPEQEIRDILEEILFKVDKRIVCRDRYDNLKSWHNQYTLFELSSIIPDFCMGEFLVFGKNFL